MNKDDIALLRLSSQQLTGTTKTSGVLQNFGAMQAQDFDMSLWALGIRNPGSTEQDILSDYNNGKIIRTHVLRPTWHNVSPDNLSWMLSISAPVLLKAQKTRQAELGLTDAVFQKCMSLIGKSLFGGVHQTRVELMSCLKAAGIDTNENRSAHVMMYAELNAVVCSGELKGNHTTYANFKDRIANGTSMSPELALKNLAMLYITSRGPVSVQDFAWWSGMPAGQARKAFEMVESSFEKSVVEGVSYLYSKKLKIPTTDQVHLLPAFDEYIISYKDRSASLSEEHRKTVITVNGLFKPTIVVNGKVIGTWRRTIKKESVLIEFDYFKSPNKKVKDAVGAATEKVAGFLELKRDLRP